MTRSNAWGRWIAAIAMAGLSGWAISAQQKPASADVLLGQALHQEQSEGQYEAAIATYRQVLKAPDATREQQARAQFRIGVCYEQLGNSEAHKAYEEVLRTFADQAEVAAQAKARLGSLRGTASPGRQTDEPDAPRIHPVAFPADFYWLATSPDGRWSLGTTTADPDNLTAIDTATGTRRAVTRGRGCPDSGKGNPCETRQGPLVWSRDSRRIAFSWLAGTDTGPVVRVSDLEGNLVREFDGSERYELLEWSPNGNELLVSAGRRGASTVGLLSLTTGGYRPVVSLAIEGIVRSGSVSADGKLAAISEPRAGLERNTDIRLIDLSTGETRWVLEDNEPSEVIAWAPGDSGILFLSDRTESRSVNVLPLRGREAVGRPTPLASFNSKISTLARPILLAEGTVMLQELASFGDLFLAPVDPALMRLRQPLQRALPQYPDEKSYPVWSPDGRLLAFYSAANGYPFGTLNVWDPDTNERRRLAVPFTMNGTPATWSAHGRRLFVHGFENSETRGIYTIDASTGSVITRSITADVGLGTVSADGKVAYESRGAPPGARAIVSVDLSTGAVRTLLDRAIGISSRLVLLRDQTHLVCALNGAPGGRASRPDRVVSIATDDSTTSVLFTVQPPAWVEAFFVAPDGGVFVRTIAEGPNASPLRSCAYVPPGGGPSRQTDVCERPGWLSVHPDGQRVAIATTGTPAPSRVLRVENLFSNLPPGPQRPGR